MLSRQNGQRLRPYARFIMLTLLAESKTMSASEYSVEDSLLMAHQPLFQESADAIMRNLSAMSPQEIADGLAISNTLSVKCKKLAFDFSHKKTGYKTMEGFTGEAFKGLDFKTLSNDVADRSEENLRIISSVYGILKPSDIIKPYRFEFNKPLAPGDKTSIQTFKARVTIDIVNYIKENNIKEIIDLLPADADKCVDWKIVRSFVSVYKILFQIYTTEDKLKTPMAKRLKELRGVMCRDILSHNIQSFKELTMFDSPDYIFSAEHSKPGLPVFITTE